MKLILFFLAIYCIVRLAIKHSQNGVVFNETFFEYFEKICMVIKNNPATIIGMFLGGGIGATLGIMAYNNNLFM